MRSPRSRGCITLLDFLTVIFLTSFLCISQTQDGLTVIEASKQPEVNGSTDAVPEKTTSLGSTEKGAHTTHHRRSSASSKPSQSGTNVDSKGSLSHRRRQWGSQSDRTTPSMPSISSDTLEKLVPTLTATSDHKSRTPDSYPTATNANLVNDGGSGVAEGHEPDDNSAETVPAENTDTSIPDSGDAESNSVTREKFSASKSVQKRSSSRTTDSTNLTAHPKPAPTKRKGPKETKAVGYLIEAPERITPCAPAKHRPTNIVHIRSLVRPFTADQLRQMISERFGPVSDLWLNRIKSTSLVRLESVEIATRCREGLDGCRWPSMNPNTLHCDFGNDELFAWMKEHGNSGENMPPKHLVLGEKPSKLDESPSSAPVPDIAGGKKPDTSAKGHHDTKSGDSRQGKTERNGGTQKAKLKDSGAKEAPDPKRRCEEPAKLLDDLFRKTTCTPSIYWLPLTDEQAQKQAVERAKLLQTNPPTATRPMGRPFVHGPTGPKQRATRSPFTSPVGGEQQPAAAPTTTRSSSSAGPRSNGIGTRSGHEDEVKEKRSATSGRAEPPQPPVNHTRKRSRSPNAKYKRTRSPLSPPRAPQPRVGSKSRDRRLTPVPARSGRPVASRREPTPYSPPRPRVVRRSTSSRSRSRSLSSASSRSSSSSRSHSRNRGNTRRGKVPYRGSGRPRSRSFGRRPSPARARR